MKKDKERSLKLNILAGMVIQVISLLVNLISKRVIRMFLGIEYLGLQSLYSNFCDVMSFAYFGMGTAMLFSMYGAFARGNSEEIASFYQYYEKLYSKTTKIVLAGSALCTFIVLYTVNREFDAMLVCVTYWIYMLSVIVFNRQLVRNYFLQADQRRYVVAFVTGGVDLVALGAEILILYWFQSYVYFLVCILLKNLIINLLLKIYLNIRYPYLEESGQPLALGEKNRISKDVKDMVIYRFGRVLISSTDSIFISKFTGTVLLGIYSNYQFVLMGVNSMVGTLYESVKGRIGYEVQAESINKQYKSFRKYLGMNSWLMGFTVTCFYFLIQDFIFLWMGAVDFLSSNIVLILLLNYYIAFSHSTVQTYREALGIFQKIRNFILIKGIMNIVLSTILGILWGLKGILIATTISSLVTVFWYEPIVVYRYFQKSIWNEVIYHVVTIVLMGISFGITYLAVNHMQGSGIAFFIQKGSICVITSNMVYALLFVIYKIGKKRRNER